MMKISINGDIQEIPNAEKLSEVLPGAKPGSPFAVAVNGEFIARGDYASLKLKEGDEIDIVSPVGGG